MSTFRSHHLAALLAVSALAAAAPAVAQADGYTCSASALSGNVLGHAVETVRAGSGGTCATDAQTLQALAAPLTGDAASAQTGMVGDRATAQTALSGVQAGALSALQSELPQIEVPAGLEALQVPLPASGQLLGLPTSITVDATSAAQQMVSRRALPDVPMLAADLVRTAVGAACRAGQVVFDSLATVEGLSALGQSLPTDHAIDTAVPLAGAQTVDFSQLDVAAIALPGGLSLSDPVTGPILRSALESAVAGLPAVSVPAAVGRVVVEPARSVDGPAARQQFGPRVRVEALGRELIDMTLGDAVVSALGVVCGAAPAAAEAPAALPEVSPATELALGCAHADVVLTDVVEKDGKVKLVGVAAPRFVGRTIDLVLTHGEQKVATAVVEPDGYFRARAPLPDRSIRFTNAARYRAMIDGERSLALKLHRRMRISRMRPEDGFITIMGRIYGAVADEVTISRRESCTKDVEVTTVKPDRDGHWRVTLPIPAGLEAATYRATTKVRRSGESKPFRTFTLPGHVAL